ncbi:hypothetical protein [Rhodovarius crocodyli]|nr:hypothetical protein [Rhodovarius crocodyli]
MLLPESRIILEISSLSRLRQSAWITNSPPSRATTWGILTGMVKFQSKGTTSDATTLIFDANGPYQGEEQSDGSIRINPIAGLATIMQPFKLIVEDQQTDGGFILWMARFLGRDEIIKAYRAGRFVFHHAGGKGQIVKSAEAISAGVWARPGQPISLAKHRSAAVLDSDADHEGHAPNANIATAAESHVAFVHVLRGRTIENYIPESYFRKRLAADGLSSFSDAFFRMLHDQQLFFPIKTGFRAKVKNGPRPTHSEFVSDPERPRLLRDLYGSVAPVDWGALVGGLGERLATVYTETRYRCEPSDAPRLPQDVSREINTLLTNILRHL